MWAGKISKKLRYEAGNTLTIGDNILSSARVVILYAVMIIFIVTVQTWLNFFSNKRPALHLLLLSPKLDPRRRLLPPHLTGPNDSRPPIKTRPPHRPRHRPRIAMGGRSSAGIYLGRFGVIHFIWLMMMRVTKNFLLG